jgi:hypothetical protein
MNYHQQGLNRDKLLIDILRDWGALDADQIVLAVPFPSKRVANRRLAKLLDLKRIKRSTYTLPYAYYIDLPTDLIDRLNRNWIRLWVIKNLHSWERLEYWDYQTYRIRNTVKNTVQEYTLTDKPLKLLDDKVVIVEESLINKIKEELKPCVR